MSAETLLNARRARRCGYCTVICETVTCCFWFEVGYPKVVMTGDCSHVGAARRIQLNKYFHLLLSCYMHIYIFIYIYISLYIYTYTYTHTQICIYIYTYTHIHVLESSLEWRLIPLKPSVVAFPHFFSVAFCKKQPYVSWKHHGFLHFLSLRHESLRNP